MKFVGKERFRRLIVDAFILLLIVIANALAQPISGPVEYGTGLSVTTASPPVVSIASSQSSLTCSSCMLSSPTISGGTINNTPIGGSTAAAGAFTSLSASGTVSGSGFSTYLASPPAIGGTAPAAGSFTAVVLETGTISAPALTIGTSFGIFQPASGEIEWESGGTAIFDYGSTISGGAYFHENLASSGSIENSSATIQLNSGGLSNNASEAYGLYNVATSGGPVISRNEADAVAVLTLKQLNSSGTGKLLDVYTSTPTEVAWIDDVGNFEATTLEAKGATGVQMEASGLSNPSSSNYGFFGLPSTTIGPLLTRNEADALPTLTISDLNSSATGDLLDLKNSGGLVASFSEAGVGNFTAGMEGVSTNSNAAAGIIGQYVSSNIASGSAVSLTSGTAANVTSISLTAGDWDVNGTVAFAPAGTTTTTSQTAAINTTSATVPTLADTAPVAIDDASLGAGVGGYLPTGTGRISLSSTTTVYLVAESTFAVSTSTAYGFIRARRVR